MIRRQHGIAVILAMGVVAVATVAATALMLIGSNWARVSQLRQQQAQAQVLVHAGVEWGRELLYLDRRLSAVDHLGETWALRLAPVAVEGGQLSGSVDDQQALFNLNNLVRGGRVDAPQLARFRHLLAILELPADLADALADWLDADVEPRGPGGAEDSYYQSLAVPYLAANQALSDVGELALVRGFDPAVRARLMPFVTALPVATAVNVNTAPAEVLATLAENLRIDAARTLVAVRDAAPFTTVAAFLARVPAGTAINAGDVAVGSDFFLLHVRVAVGETEARSSALLGRDAGRWPAVIWRRAT